MKKEEAKPVAEFHNENIEGKIFKLTHCQEIKISKNLFIAFLRQSRTFLKINLRVYWLFQHEP